MLDVRAVVRTDKEADACLERIRSDVMSSAITDQQKAFLLDAVNSTIRMWRAQMARPHVRSLKAEKRFEGDGFKVVLVAKPPRAGMAIIGRWFARLS